MNYNCICDAAKVNGYGEKKGMTMDEKLKLIYYGFEVEESPAIGDIPAKITITYDFEIPQGVVFSPSWEIPCAKENVLDDDAILEKIFMLGMAELTGCFIKECSYEVVIEPFLLRKEQILEWEECFNSIFSSLYFKQEKEHMYRVSIVNNAEEKLPYNRNNHKVGSDKLVFVDKNIIETGEPKVEAELTSIVGYTINVDADFMSALYDLGYRRMISVCYNRDEKMIGQSAMQSDLLVHYSADFVAELFGLNYE
ncbi:MAG: hypothetical protein IIX48_00920 [Lachnospiraceae bacterium]|nr:hypothetical protein [Lachnospiraceae bacterium]